MKKVAKKSVKTLVVKKRNQADSTLRNVRASNKNFVEIAKMCANLALALIDVKKRLQAVEHVIDEIRLHARPGR